MAVLDTARHVVLVACSGSAHLLGCR